MSQVDYRGAAAAICDKDLKNCGLRKKTEEKKQRRDLPEFLCAIRTLYFIVYAELIQRHHVPEQ